MSMDDNNLSNTKGVFVDRVDITSSFEKKIADFKKNMSMDGERKIQVISYYGLGGIGKSTLLDKIKKDYLDKDHTINNKEDNNKNNQKDNSWSLAGIQSWGSSFFRKNNDDTPSCNKPVYSMGVCYDMGKSTDIDEIIFSLKNELINECGFKFPQVDVFEIVYNYLRGEDVIDKITRSEPGNLTEIEDLINDKSPYYKIGLNLVGELPRFGVIFKAIAMFYDAKETKEKKAEARKALNQFLKEKQKAPLTLVKELEQLFISELNWNLEDLKEPLVIMFDRFEETINKEETAANSLDFAYWIHHERGLISSVKPKVLWVIAGREELQWEKRPFWKGKLETMEVKPLNEDFTKELLHKRQVPADLCAVLTDVTGGVPEYIDLCIEHAELLKAQNKKEITREDFCGDNNYDDREAMVDRFINHLPVKQKNMLYYLSVFDDWTDDMVKKVVLKVWEGKEYDFMNTYEKVKKLTSFFALNKNGKYEMNEVAKDLLYTKLREDNTAVVSEILRQTIEYLKNDLHINNSNENYNQLMKYALKLYNRDNEEDNNGLIAVYEEFFKNYLKNVDYFDFIEQYEKIFEPFIQRAVNSKSERLKAYGYANRGYYLNCIGEYKKACEDNEIALRLCKEEFGEENPDTINVMSNLAEDYMENIDSEDPNLFTQFEKALELREKVLAFRKTDKGEKHPDTINALADVADSYRWVFKYEEAVKFGQEVLALYKEVLGPRSPYTIYARTNLSCYLTCWIEDGDKYSKEKYKELYEEVLKLDEETLQLSKEVFGEKNEDTIKAMIEVANDLTLLGIDEERADDLNRKVTEYFSKMENDYSSEE